RTRCSSRVSPLWEELDLQVGLQLGRASHDNSTVNPGTAALTRGLAILEVLADDAGGGLGVVRLAELLGDDKSQVSRPLETLAEHGYVERDPASLAYRLGWGPVALA